MTKRPAKRASPPRKARSGDAGKKRPQKKQKKATSAAQETAADVAYRLIKGKILGRDYAPGQFLHEMAICAEIDLGRTPVHQALHRLQLERLVSIIPRKGIMVDPVSPSDIVTVLEVRELIEPYCASQAARQITPAVIEAMRAILERGKAAIAGQDMIKFMEADRQFHELLVKTAGNELIIDFLHSLHGRVARIWRAPSWSHMDYDKTFEEHSRIAEAVCAGDQDGASAAMRNHIVSLRVRVMKQFFTPPAVDRLSETRDGTRGETALHRREEA